MNMNQVNQTTFDQMVNTENNQMLKAIIPYLPPNAQKFLSFYTKTTELSNTFRMYSSQNNMQICSAPVSDTNPCTILNDIKKYCYGENQQHLDKLNNIFVMLEMLSLMNQP